MEEKKATKAALERRIANAVVLVDKTKDTQSVYFDDKGLRLTVTEDYAVIATGAHQHVFDRTTLSGVSRPYMYISLLVSMAIENDCTTKDAQGNVTRSYSKLFSILKGKEDNKDYGIAWFIDLWLYNIFAPLYSIGESVTETALVYEDYMHNIAKNEIIFREKTEDMTNVQFVNEVLTKEKEFSASMPESVIFKKRTDEEFVQEQINAIEQNEMEQYLSGQASSANDTKE